MKQWKVALAQIHPLLGDISCNIKKHLEFISHARKHSAKLIVFPELSLTGYSLMDAVLEVYKPISDPVIRQLINESHDIDIVFGFYEQGEDYIPYISSLYASKGNIVHVHRKIYNPTYGLFDEARFVGSGQQFRAFNTEGFRSAILICEDAWHLSSGYVLGQDGALCLIVPSAGPGKGVGVGTGLQSVEAWNQVLTLQAKIYQTYILYVNRIGFEDGVYFGGGSSVIGPDGVIRKQADSFKEDLVVHTLLESELRNCRIVTPSVRDEKVEIIIQELQRIRNEKNIPLHSKLRRET